MTSMSFDFQNADLTPTTQTHALCGRNKLTET